MLRLRKQDLVSTNNTGQKQNCIPDFHFKTYQFEKIKLKFQKTWTHNETKQLRFLETFVLGLLLEQWRLTMVDVLVDLHKITESRLMNRQKMIDIILKVL